MYHDTNHKKKHDTFSKVPKKFHMMKINKLSNILKYRSSGSNFQHTNQTRRHKNRCGHNQPLIEGECM